MEVINVESDIDVTAEDLHVAFAAELDADLEAESFFADLEAESFFAELDAELAKRLS